MQWIDRVMSILEMHGKLQVAEEAKNLDDNRKVLATDRAVVDAHHRMHLGAHYQSPQEDGVIHLGDSVQHVHPPPGPAGGGLLRTLAAAAFGGGVALAAPVVLDAVMPDPPPAVAPAEPTPIAPTPPTPAGPDHDTLFELRLGPPKRPVGSIPARRTD